MRISGRVAERHDGLPAARAIPSRAGHTSGGPSALVAYGSWADDRLRYSFADGALATGPFLR